MIEKIRKPLRLSNPQSIFIITMSKYIDNSSFMHMYNNDKMDGDTFITRIFDFDEYGYNGFIDFNTMIQYIRFIKNNNIIFDKKIFMNKLWKINIVDTFSIFFRFRKIPMTTYITNKLNCQLC